LERVGNQLHEDMKSIEEREEAPEKVAEICSDIDDKLVDSMNLFLDAVENMMEFIETEKPELIDNAKKDILKSEELIKQGDNLSIELEELFEERGFTI